jgi:hypothetical protein
MYTQEVDSHGNSIVLFTPLLQGTYKIIGVINGREFEGHLFALNKPSYEELFEFKDDLIAKTVGQPYSIILHEPDLEVDIIGKFSKFSKFKFSKLFCSNFDFYLI